MTEFERNQALAKRICRDFQADGKTLHSGQCVALLAGKVVAVADDLDGALKALRAVEPNPARGMVFEVSHPFVEVIR